MPVAGSVPAEVPGDSIEPRQEPSGTGQRCERSGVLSKGCGSGVRPADDFVLAGRVGSRLYAPGKFGPAHGRDDVTGAFRGAGWLPPEQRVSLRGIRPLREVVNRAVS
jgi:hypothetical protein